MEDSGDNIFIKDSIKDSEDYEDYYGLYCPSLDEFKEWLNAIDDSNLDNDVNILSVTMPCGEIISYRRKTDIPLNSVPCPCGNVNHWVIKVG